MRDVVVVDVLVLEDSELLFSIWKEGMRCFTRVYYFSLYAFLTCCDDDILEAAFSFELCIKDAVFCLLFLLNFSNKDGGIVSLVSAMMVDVARKTEQK